MVVLLAYSVATVFGWAAEFFFVKLRSKPALTVTLSEMCFFDAYNLHASAIGAMTRNVGVSDEELEESNWILPFMEYIGALSDQVRQMMGVKREGENDEWK